ncbi:MAG: HPr(Ser) kinase/phosphatase [Eubacteriales bacterium]|nr:HPr(Ser) kinase/phosphatase [Eubacteriales bacterium]
MEEEKTGFSVGIKEIIKEFNLIEVTGCNRLDEIAITTSDVNRPGLQLAGYLDYFGNDRIQIIGTVETSYMELMTRERRYNSLKAFFATGFPCIVVARNLDIFPEMLQVAKEFDIPVLRSKEITSRLLAGLIKYLNVELAPRETKHGVFVEVYGEGILILGESGVGKSETALELVKRGHRLIADDVVEVRRVSETTLLGTSPDIIRHFIEIRGIGILDVKNLYGVGSVKMQETVNLVIQLEAWDENKVYDRLGIDDVYMDILGISIPTLTIPVRPGRNLAIIVEIAAMNNRQKEMGYNAAKVLNDKLYGKG